MAGPARLPPSPSLTRGPHPPSSSSSGRSPTTLQPLARARAATSRLSPPLPETATASPLKPHPWLPILLLKRPSTVINGVGRAPSTQPLPLPPLAPIKGHRSTSCHHHTHPYPSLLAPLSATPTSPSTDYRRPSLSTVPPFPHLSSSDEPTNVLTATSSTSPVPSPVTLSPGVAGGLAPMCSRGRPWRRSMVNRRRPWSTNCGLDPRVFCQQNNSLKILFPGTLHLSP
jgi:hypothetical protein